MFNEKIYWIYSIHLIFASSLFISYFWIRSQAIDIHFEIHHCQFNYTLELVKFIGILPMIYFLFYLKKLIDFQHTIARQKHYAYLYCQRKK